MIDYIKGTITQITPTFLTIETGGIGYFINISLTTFSKLEGKSDFKILVHEVIREDAHQLFGFADKEERDIFRLLDFSFRCWCKYCKNDAFFTQSRMKLKKQL